MGVISDIVNKLRGFCHTLRHDGINHSYYIEQITYLLFLKMADVRGLELPKGCGWAILRDGSGSELKDAFTDMLRARQENRAARRHLHRRAEPLHQAGESEATRQPHRRNTSGPNSTRT